MGREKFLSLILGGVILGNLLLGSTVWGQPVLNLAEGYASDQAALNLGGGFDFLPGGDIIGINFDYQNPPVIFIFDANGDGVPSSPLTIGTLGAGLFGSFIKVAPGGQFALFGATGASNPIKKIDLASYAVTEVSQILGNQSLVFLDDRAALVSANQDFSPESPNRILYLDINNPGQIKTAVEIADTPSGPIARNSAGDVYYVKSTWQFPPPPNSHKLLKFKTSQVQAAIMNGYVLHEDASLISIPLDGGYNIAINAFNDIFVSSLKGEIFKVNERDGTAAEFCVTANFPNEGSFSHLAFYQPNKFFNAFAPSVSKMGAAYADIYYTNFCFVALAPDPSDAFADEVVSFRPGLGGGGDPQKVLGPPVGGGTYIPDNSSIVLLGDRDNPDKNAPATIEVRFLNPIQDSAQGFYGLDLIAFGNAFWAGGDPHNRFAEPVIVEVSQDFNHNGLADDEWFFVEPNLLPSDLGPLSPAEYATMTLRHYAEYTPTLLLGDLDSDNVVDDPDMDPEDFYTVPDRLTYDADELSFRIDPNSGGGDAVDLRDAIAQGEPGVPYTDAFGKKRHAYLEQVDFVRLRDARSGDFHAQVGPVNADIDAVAAAKPRLRGTSVRVSSVSQLEAALAAAQPDDEIVLDPGEYVLARSLRVPPGVSLKGSDGLWTVNDKGDDAILDGKNLSPGTAAVNTADPQGTFIPDQGYTISGIHFLRCSVGISVQALSPVIERNVFTDTAKAISLQGGAAGQTVIIRHNIFGHKISAAMQYGIEAADATLGILHNIFTGAQAAAAALGSGTESQVRDNIFFGSAVGVDADLSSYVHGENNVFYLNPIKYEVVTGFFESDVLADPAFASPRSGDYRLSVASPVRGQGMGGSDPGVYDGSNFYPLDVKPPYLLNLRPYQKM